MDVRVLRYFLTVAREESFSRAAETLYLSQSTLSRQIKDLEDELGTALFLRNSRSVALTREGMRLRKRAQEIVDLMDKTRDEFACAEEDVAGDICIGGGETHAMRCIAKVAVAVRREHPGIRYHLYSGNADDVLERLDKGLLDLGILIGGVDERKYDFYRVPGRDTWGLLMRRDHPLSRLEAVGADQLDGVPLLLSRQTRGASRVLRWLGKSAEEIDVAATYNLVFNAAMMVEQGMGCALCLDHLVNAVDSSELCFRPLTPPLEEELRIVWKKYQVLAPAPELFLNRVRAAFGGK